MEKLKLSDIACYLPYGLKVVDLKPTSKTVGALRVFGFETNHIVNLKFVDAGVFVKSNDFEDSKLYCIKFTQIKPILRPISDLNKSLEDGTIPIVELAKIFSPHYEWELRKDFVEAKTGGGIYTFEFDESYNIFLADNSANCVNQIQLFDYLNEYHFDYRGLIDKGLAIDVNNLKLI